jgi:leucyl/phenylalanyl-tRNA--protein transferase
VTRPSLPVERALREPNGLLCAGGDLSPARLLDAYRHGIFPWYSKASPSSGGARTRAWCCFRRSSENLALARQGPCGNRITKSASTRPFRPSSANAPAARGQDGTWITPEMQAGLLRRLHELGHAHCVETWIDGALAGGLYGMAIGACSTASRCSRANRRLEDRPRPPGALS